METLLTLAVNMKPAVALETLLTAALTVTVEICHCCNHEMLLTVLTVTMETC